MDFRFHQQEIYNKTVDNGFVVYYICIESVELESQFHPSGSVKNTAGEFEEIVGNLLNLRHSEPNGKKRYTCIGSQM